MKKILILLCCLTLNLGFNFSYAQGIPVYDNANVMQGAQNFMKEIEEMAKQLKTATDQLNTAKSQLDSFKAEALEMKKRFEGISGFVNNFDKESFTKSLDELINKVDSSAIDDFIKKNNLNSGADAHAQKSFERMGETYSQYDILVKQTKQKNQELDNLKNQFKNADTPQKREEISNTIAMEKVQLDNTNKAVEYEMKKKEVENKAKEKEEYSKTLLDELFSTEY